MHLVGMKKVFLLFLLIPGFTIAQTKVDSIEVMIDTIHVHGYVYDKFDNPIKGVQISSGKLHTTTSLENGYFELKGIEKGTSISFIKDSLSDRLHNIDSRFIVHHLAPIPTKRLTSYDNQIIIEAKRTAQKPLFKKKIRNSFIGHYHEIIAIYPGGINKFYKYIKENLKYPEKAIANHIEGLVTIEFDVTKTGATGNFKVIRDIGYGGAEALIEVVKKSKKWNPAMSNGKPVAQRYYLEIPFKLTE